jgi:TIR domain
MAWWRQSRDRLGSKPSQRSLRVFISYAAEDRESVMRLGQRLRADGVDAWLDVDSLLPGQEWRAEISRAIHDADAMIVCLSTASATSKSLNMEVGAALEIQSQRPEGTIFLVPVRLEECTVPFLLTHYHWVDIFKNGGYERLLRALLSRRPEELDLSLTIQIANRAKNVKDLSTLSTIVRDLPEGTEGYLAQTALLKRRVSEIVSLQTRLHTLDRAIFREQVAHLLKQEIELFRHEVSDFLEPLSGAFADAAKSWLRLADRQLAQAMRIAGRQPVRQLFRAGDPVDRDQEAFVRRDGVIGRLEQQVSLSTGCPGVILYGRRRRGKSTVLRNLTGSGFLPDSILSAVFSMQEPQAFSSLEGLLGRITSTVSEQARLVVGRRPDSSVEPSYFRPVVEVRRLTDLYRFLNIWDTQLKRSDSRLIIAIDEYEAIDGKIGDKIFPIDLLATIRESIQTHRNITWIFSGSHDIDELTNADWTSFLVSARTVDVPCFTLAETRILLTDPLQHSSIWNSKPEQRPRFSPDFWGIGGIERIHQEAGGWPHLVQLLAETYVDLINECESPYEDDTVMEQCISEAVDRGRTVLSQLMRGESKIPGEWDYLLNFREQLFQAPPTDASIARSLKRREIVVEEDGRWHLQVPLMLRWLNSHA